MAGELVADSVIVSNHPGSSSANLSVFLFDKKGTLLLQVKSGEVSHAETFRADYVRVFPLGPWNYVFPEKITLNPGDVIHFTPLLGGLKTVSIFVEGELTMTFDLVRVAPPKATFADTVLEANHDTYMDKVLSLAKVHAKLGSTRAQFNADLKAKRIKDTAPTKKLTKEQFKIVNNANANIRLKGTASEESDQQIYDETAMLMTAVNTRLAAVANAAHPDQWDISIPANQIAMINAAANGLFNWYYSHMGAFETSVNMSSLEMKNSYNTTTIKLDAIVDLFKSLSLPEDKLLELSGAVDAFVGSMKNLSFGSSEKSLHNVKLVNFFSIQPPVGSPKLAKVSKMRMFYLQFNESTQEWSSSCVDHATYSLDINLFQMDVEINREVAHLTYEHNKNMVVANAEEALDAMGAAGAQDVIPPIKTSGPSPIGPSPVSLESVRRGRHLKRKRKLRDVRLGRRNPA